MKHYSIILEVLLATCFLFACTQKEEVVAVTSVSISQPTAEMIIGETVQLSAKVYPSSATYTSITWSSSNPSIATVSSSGLVTAIEEGNATVYASVGSVKTECIITVVKPKPTFSISTTTKSATDITCVSAKLNGSFVITGDGVLNSEACFYYTTTKTTSWDPQISWTRLDVGKVSDSTGAFEITISGLVPETEYYYVAVISNDLGQSVGEVLSFKTLEDSVDVTTEGCSNIGLFTATVSGKLSVASGNYQSCSVWFYVGEYSNIDQLKSSSIHLSSELRGDYTFEATIISSWFGLRYNTTYFYVACAKVDEQEYYGEIRSFKTNDISASVRTLDATNIGPCVATLGGYLEVNNEEDLDKTVWVLYSNEYSTLEDLVSNGEKADATLNADGFFYSPVRRLGLNKTCYYTVGAKVYDRIMYGSVKSFTTTTREVPDGAVELGLSVMWGSCNLGAKKPEEIGDYYAWGDVVPYYSQIGSFGGSPHIYGWKDGKSSGYTWESYKWCNGSENTLTKYYPSPENTYWKKQYWGGYGEPDGKTVLDPEDDAAFVKLGGTWRIPTKEECTELLHNCDVRIIRVDDKNILKVTSKLNGNSIYLPYGGFVDDTGFSLLDRTGFYWSSSLDDYYYGEPVYAKVIDMNDGGAGESYRALVSIMSRCKGSNIRPVCE